MKSVKYVMIIAALLGIMVVAQTVAAESGVETDDEDDVIVFESTEQGDTQSETNELPSADIIEVSYDRVDGGTAITVMFKVNDKGEVEEPLNLENLDNIGDLLSSDPFPFQYRVMVRTDQSEYFVDLALGNCTLNFGEVINYTIDGNEFSASFDLDSSDETITGIAAQTMFLKIVGDTGYNFYIDAAPNSFLFMADIEAPSTGETGEEIEFVGFAANIADEVFGDSLIDYSYEWDFDDGSTGSGETVTHSYQFPGNYTVELTVSDDEGTETTATKLITITQGSSSNNGNSNNGNNDGDDSNDSPLLIFIAIIGIIVVIGIIALVVVIRR